MAIGRTEQPELATTPDGGTSAKDIKGILESLIRVDRDAAHGLRVASDGFGDSERAETFRRLADERAGFAAELVDLGYRYLGDAPTGESITSGLRRAWTDIEGAFRSGDAGIIETAGTEEQHAIDIYADALEADLPSDLDAVIRRQYTAVMQARDHVRAMGRTS